MPHAAVPTHQTHPVAAGTPGSCCASCETPKQWQRTAAAAREEQRAARRRRDLACDVTAVRLVSQFACWASRNHSCVHAIDAARGRMMTGRAVKHAVPPSARFVGSGSYAQAWALGGIGCSIRDPHCSLRSSAAWQHAREPAVGPRPAPAQDKRLQAAALAQSIVEDTSHVGEQVGSTMPLPEHPACHAACVDRSPLLPVAAALGSIQCQAAPFDLIGLTLIVDDIVNPDGSRCMKDPCLARPFTRRIATHTSLMGPSFSCPAAPWAASAAAGPKPSGAFSSSGVSRLAWAWPLVWDPTCRQPAAAGWSGAASTPAACCCVRAPRRPAPGRWAVLAPAHAGPLLIALLGTRPC